MLFLSYTYISTIIYIMSRGGNQTSQRGAISATKLVPGGTNLVAVLIKGGLLEEGGGGGGQIRYDRHNNDVCLQVPLTIRLHCTIHHRYMDEGLYLSPLLSSFLISTFLQTLYSFHCADTAGSIPQDEEGHDPLYKHTLTVTKTFNTHYKAACEPTIDDSMIGTKCILHYLLKKPTVK